MSDIIDYDIIEWKLVIRNRLLETFFRATSENSYENIFIGLHFLPDPSWHLDFESQQWKYQNNI